MCYSVQCECIGSRHHWWPSQLCYWLEQLLVMELTMTRVLWDHTGHPLAWSTCKSASTWQLTQTVAYTHGYTCWVWIAILNSCAHRSDTHNGEFHLDLKYFVALIISCRNNSGVKFSHEFSTMQAKSHSTYQQNLLKRLNDASLCFT